MSSRLLGTRNLRKFHKNCQEIDKLIITLKIMHFLAKYLLIQKMRPFVLAISKS